LEGAVGILKAEQKCEGELRISVELNTAQKGEIENLKPKSRLKQADLPR
jgi:hypothetical protein